MKTINKVILGFALTGLIILIAGFCFDGYQQTRTILIENDYYWGWRGFNKTDISREFTDIQNLDFEIDVANVEIIEYDGSTILVEAKDVNKKIKIIDNNGTLTINDNSSFWGLGIAIYNGNGDIVVSVPRGTTFDHVDLDVAAGSINVDTLSAKVLKVNVDAGKLIADTIVTTQATFEADAGKMEIYKLDGQDLEFDVDAGRIEATVVGSDADYRYQAECDVGSLTIGSYSAHGIDSKDSGGNGSRRISADCSAGKINIEMGGW